MVLSTITYKSMKKSEIFYRNADYVNAHAIERLSVLYIASDRLRAARCAFSHIKLEKRALFSEQMREFRIYYF